MKSSVITLLLLFPVMFVQNAVAQGAKEWNGKSCAVVLTYDDALNVHLDNVIPCLNANGLKGTFYVTGESDVLNKRMEEWRKAAKQGHELGNHTMHHPCDAQQAGRSWVQADQDLSKYTVARAVNEIKVTNTLLKAIDGKTERSFAYPCGDKTINGANYYTPIQDQFTGARGVQDGMQKIEEIDLSDIRCYMINGQQGKYLIDLVKKAMESHTLLVFLFHGVGGEHNINVSAEAHKELAQFIQQHKGEIWNAPMVEVTKYVKEKQKGKKK